MIFAIWLKLQGILNTRRYHGMHYRKKHTPLALRKSITTSLMDLLRNIRTNIVYRILAVTLKILELMKNRTLFQIHVARMHKMVLADFLNILQFDPFYKDR